MPDLTFYGASDDLMEVEGLISEEWSGERGTFLVVAPDGTQAYVRLTFEQNGCWSVAYWPVDEDAKGFEGAIYHARYSAKLNLGVPAGTRIHQVHLDG